jgi:hypothetical protein
MRDMKLRKQLVSIACECARLCLKYSEGPQPLEAIEAAESWLKGEATIEEVKACAISSAHFATDIGYSAFCATAYSAYNAAYTVYTDDPIDSARRAIDSCAFANREETLKTCATIIDKHGFRLLPNA